MSEKIVLTAELRTDVGKGASRRLRRLGDKVPAIIYGSEKDPQTLTLSAHDLVKVMEQEAFFSQIMDVVVADTAPQQAVVRDLQRNPSNGKVTHVDFQRISADREMTVSVPLHFINEDKCVGVRMSGGVITHSLTEVEIVCLPRDLPQFIEVDVQELDEGDSVHLSDLVLPEGVAIVALSYGDEDRDIPVASVTVPRGPTPEELDEAEASEAAAEGDADTDADADADSDASDDAGGDDDTD